MDEMIRFILSVKGLLLISIVTVVWGVQRLERAINHIGDIVDSWDYLTETSKRALDERRYKYETAGYDAALGKTKDE